MIYTVTLNPAIDRELVVSSIVYDTVLRASQWRVDYGGKGFNVARMLKSLGTPSVALAFAGGNNGEILNRGLQSIGIETDLVWVEEETRTNISIVGSDQGRYVKVNEPGPTIATENISALQQKVHQLVQPDDWWVLAGSLPPGVPSSIYADMITIIQEAGARAILDTSDEALLHGCRARPYLVKPNAAEACKLTGQALEEKMDTIAAVANEIQAMGPENVVISMGKEGALLTNGQRTWTASSPEIIELNPIGAGDAMVGGLVWGLSQGQNHAGALSMGVACGAATAGQRGTSVGSSESINVLRSQIEIIEHGKR